MEDDLEKEDIDFLLEVLDYAIEGYYKKIQKYSNFVDYIKTIYPTKKFMFEKVKEKLKKMKSNL